MPRGQHQTEREHGRRPRSAAPSLLAGVAGAIVAVGAAASCIDDQPLGGSGEARVIVADVPPIILHEVDLLFVVDNTDTMAAKQADLIASFARLRRYLEYADGGLPDLHVGILSTDMGVGGEFAVGGCSTEGDAATLQATPRLADCVGPTDAPFLRYAWDPDGSEAKNFEGTLEEAFACIAALGTGGCRFEQPLAALGRLLEAERTTADGFLRDDAVLGLVFLSDEDDCSVKEGSFFDPALYGFDDGVSKYRCFREGVQCRGDDAFIGQREECEPEAGSVYLDDVYARAEELHQAKTEDRQIVVSAITGSSEHIEVEGYTLPQGDDELLSLAPSCEGPAGAAFPAVRLKAFADDFTHSGGAGALCPEDGADDSDGLDILTSTGKELRDALGHPCLAGRVRDVDPITAGRQVDCEVWAELPDGTRVDVPACEHPYAVETSTAPCYAIKAGPAACIDFPTQLALQTNWGAAGLPTGAQTKVACLVDPA